MIAYLSIAVIFGLIGLWNLMIAILGLFPQFRATAVGTLTKARSSHNVRCRHCVIPVLTKYVYIYSVNGRQYKYTREDPKPRRKLFPKASMVYVKWFPRRAYPNKFTGEMEWIFGALSLMMAIMISLSLISQ